MSPDGIDYMVWDGTLGLWSVRPLAGPMLECPEGLWQTQVGVQGFFLFIHAHNKTGTQRPAKSHLTGAPDDQPLAQGRAGLPEMNPSTWRVTIFVVQSAPFAGGVRVANCFGPATNVHSHRCLCFAQTDESNSHTHSFHIPASPSVDSSLV